MNHKKYVEKEIYNNYPKYVPRNENKNFIDNIDSWYSDRDKYYLYIYYKGYPKYIGSMSENNNGTMRSRIDSCLKAIREEIQRKYK